MLPVLCECAGLNGVVDGAAELGSDGATSLVEDVVRACVPGCTRVD